MRIFDWPMPGSRPSEHHIRAKVVRHNSQCLQHDDLGKVQSAIAPRNFTKHKTMHSVQTTFVWQQVSKPGLNEASAFFYCDYENRSILHLQLKPDAKNGQQLLANVHASLSLDIGQFMRTFSTAPVYKIEFIEVLIDGALWRAKFCCQCTSALLLFHHFKERLIFHNRRQLALYSNLLSSSLKCLNHLCTTLSLTIPGHSTSGILLAAVFALIPFLHRLW